MKWTVAENSISLNMKTLVLGAFFFKIFNFLQCINMPNNSILLCFCSSLKTEECCCGSQHVFVFQLLSWKAILNKSTVLKFPSKLLHSFCSKTDRLAKGSECYQKSLSLNPFLWSPFESLCEIGRSAELSSQWRYFLRFLVMSSFPICHPHVVAFLCCV